MVSEYQPKLSSLGEDDGTSSGQLDNILFVEYKMNGYDLFVRKKKNARTTSYFRIELDYYLEELFSWTKWFWYFATVENQWR